MIPAPKQKCLHCMGRYAPNQMAAHLENCERERPFVCPFPNCGRRFHSAAGVSIHEASSHPRAKQRGNSRFKKLRIDFSTCEPDATIKVDNVDIQVNKHLLALSSSYFDRYFFDSRYPPAKNIELEPPTTVEQFKLILDILRANVPSSMDEAAFDKQIDENFEGILSLADRFVMDNVKKYCRRFLLHKSKRSKLFKFRIAHKYAWIGTKAKILRKMKLDDFEPKKFLQNAKEYEQLDEEAEAELAARHAELVTGEYGPSSPNEESSSSDYSESGGEMEM